MRNQNTDFFLVLSKIRIVYPFKSYASLSLYCVHQIYLMLHLNMFTFNLTFFIRG